VLEELQMEENFGMNVFLDTALSASVNKCVTLVEMYIWKFSNFTV
jgi:hypothetical protein